MSPLPSDQARPSHPTVGFETRKLDARKEEAGLDVLLATSKHNLGCLLGGCHFFYSAMDTHCLGRSWPCSIYFRGAPELTAYAAHGMGIVSHEAPWLSDRSAVPYPGYHAERPLEAGMEILIETTLKHSRRGLIKLEDPLTEAGCDGFCDGGPGGNRGRSG